MDEKDCTTCKKNNKGDNWRDCRLKCHYKYEQQKKDEIYKLQEEKESLQKRFNAYQDRLRKINHELAEEHKTIGQDLYAEIKDYRKENENLKQQLEIDKNQINYFIEENEKQKEQIKQLEDFIKSDGEIDHINHEYTYKLKQTLQEIKAICEMDCGDCQYNQDCDCNFEECEEAKIDDILDLITETEFPDQKESEA